MSHYTRFFAMILTSTVVMFVAMYFNTYAFDHVYFSETRACQVTTNGGSSRLDAGHDPAPFHRNPDQ